MSVDILELDQAAAEIIRILKQFIKWCQLDDDDEPHTQNQKILYNSGKDGHVTFLSSVFTILLLLSLIKEFSLMSSTTSYGSAAASMIPSSR